MARYILVDGNNDARASGTKLLPNPTGHPDWRWLKEVITRPSHDPETEVVEQAVTTRTETEYRIEYPVRSMTEQELADYKSKRAAEFVGGSVVTMRALLAVMAAIKDPKLAPSLPSDKAQLVKWLEKI